MIEAYWKSICFAREWSQVQSLATLAKGSQVPSDLKDFSSVFLSQTTPSSPPASGLDYYDSFMSSGVKMHSNVDSPQND